MTIKEHDQGHQSVTLSLIAYSNGTLASNSGLGHAWVWANEADLSWCPRCGEVDRLVDPHVTAECSTPEGALSVTEAELEEMRQLHRTHFYDFHNSKQVVHFNKSQAAILTTGRLITVWGSGEIEQGHGREHHYLLSIRHHRVGAA